MFTSSKVKCKDSGHCVTEQRVCDHVKDCKDGTDESQCSSRKASCDFEINWCGWFNYYYDDFNWLRQRQIGTTGTGVIFDFFRNALALQFNSSGRTLVHPQCYKNVVALALCGLLSLACVARVRVEHSEKKREGNKFLYCSNARVTNCVVCNGLVISYSSCRFNSTYDYLARYLGLACLLLCVLILG